MDDRFRWLRWGIAGIVLSANVVALSACSSSTGPVAPAVPGVRSERPTTSYITVDDSACTGSCANEVAGINDSRDVVGNYSHCTSSGSAACSAQDWECNPGDGGSCQPCPLVGGNNAWQSFTSGYNGTSYATFTSAQFPDAPEGQYMSAISDRLTTSEASPPPAIEVGCINSFAGSPTGNGEENGVWGLFNGNGLWSVQDKGPASGCDSKPDFYGTGELLGYDSSNTTTPTAVGFYSADNCSFRAGEVQAGTNWQSITPSFGTFDPTDYMATGITGSSSSSTTYIVGMATKSLTTVAAHKMVGWVQRPSGAALIYSYPGATSTAFTSIAKVGTAEEAVGWYTLPVSAGSGAGTHGVMVPIPSTGATLTGTTINEPNAHGLTVVSGVNTGGDICGWYIDTSKVYHGFVGLGIVPALKAHQQRRESRHAPMQPPI